MSYCDISIEKMKKIVVKWLKKYKIVYDKLVFNIGSKLDALRDNKIDIMIEDNPRVIKEIVREFKVFCFDERYNQDLRDKNLTRVYSWYDIYDKLKNREEI